MLTRRMLLNRTFLLLATLWSYASAECVITVSSDEFSCESILSSVDAGTCDGCYLFCAGKYSKCVSTLDDAQCEGDLVASVCGDEQRSGGGSGGGGGTSGITDGSQTSSALRRSVIGAVAPVALLLAPSVARVAAALEELCQDIL